MSMNGIHGEQGIFQRIRINLLMILVIVFSCEITFAAENITMETKTGNFFENLVSDTLLLLDPDLKKIIVDDFDHVVANSKFELPVNSWKPRPNPKIRLAVIYDRFNSNNVKESLASFVQPVVEIACSPQKHDPLSEYQSKCIKEMFGYPIIQPIEIKYTYESGKTKEQYITDLTGLNNSNRYQQIVRTTADIMNSAFEKMHNKKIVKAVSITKSPLPIVASGVSSGSGRSYGNTGASTDSSNCRKPSPPTTRINSISRNPGTGSTITSYKTDNAEQYNIDMKGYEHRLDIEKIKAGGNLADIKQRRAQQVQQQQAQEEEKHRVNHGAINPFTGEFLAPAGDGYVGTRDGTYYTPAGSHGIINTRTGEFSPLTK